MPRDKTTTVDIEKDGKSYRINVPSSYLGEVDKDGNATITNPEGFRDILDQEINTQEISRKERKIQRAKHSLTGRGAEQEQEELHPEQGQLSDIIPPMIMPYDPTSPKFRDSSILDKSLQLGNDALHTIGSFFTPEMAAYTATNPGKMLLQSGAGYGISKLADEFGANPEESEAAGNAVGLLSASPKVRGAVAGGAGNINPYRGGAAGFLGKMLFGNKGGEIFPLLSELPAAARGAIIGARGKPLLPDIGVTKVPEEEEGSYQPGAGGSPIHPILSYGRGLETEKSLPGAYNHPSANVRYNQLTGPQKLLTAPKEDNSNKFNVRSGGDELPFTPKKATKEEPTAEEPKAEEKPKRTVTRKVDEEKQRLKGYQKTAEKAGKTIRKVLRTDKTKDQRTAEDLVKGLEEGRTYTDEGEEKAPVKKQEEPDKPKRIVKRTTKSSIKTKKEEKVKETEKPKEETKPEIKTQSDIEEHANNNGIGTDEAEKQLKDEGHVVLNRQQLNRAVHGLARQKGLTHQDISDMASTAHNVDSLTKLTDKQLHEIFKYVDQLPDKKLETTNKSNLNKEGKPNTKDDLIDKLKESLKRVKKKDTQE